MNEVYIQGFIDKCAEHGVDHRSLIKESLPSFPHRPFQRGMQIINLRNLIGPESAIHTVGGPITTAFNRIPRPYTTLLHHLQSEYITRPKLLQAVKKDRALLRERKSLGEVL